MNARGAARNRKNNDISDKTLFNPGLYFLTFKSVFLQKIVLITYNIFPCWGYLRLQVIVHDRVNNNKDNLTN